MSLKEYTADLNPKKIVHYCVSKMQIETTSFALSKNQQGPFWYGHRHEEMVDMKGLATISSISEQVDQTTIMAEPGKVVVLVTYKKLTQYFQ